MSRTAALRDEVYWNQRCIAAEARCIAAEAKSQAQSFEIANLKISLKRSQQQSTYWQQKFILAEAKVQASQLSESHDNVARGTGTPEHSSGAPARKRPFRE